MMAPIAIVAPRFFPERTVGALRPTAWAKLLPDFGWAPFVVSPYRVGYSGDGGQEPAFDMTYLEGERTLEASDPAGGPARPAGALRRVLASLALLDPSIGRWIRARKKVYSLIAERGARVVITTGPPHSIHLVGLYARAKSESLVWVADFRDPYLIDPRYKASGPPLVGAMANRRFARQVYSNADLVTSAIPVHARWLRRYGPGRPAQVEWVPNGIDQAALCLPLPRERAGYDALVCSVGSAGSAELLGLAEALRTIPKDSEALSLCCVGRIPSNAEDVRNILVGQARFTGRLPHAAALASMSKARILVALLSKERSRGLGLSTKVLEYLGFPCPVVIVNPTRSDRHLMRKVSGVFFIDSASPDALRATLMEALRQPHEPLLRRAQLWRAEWNRERQVARLSGLIEQALDRRTPHSPRGGSKP